MTRLRRIEDRDRFFFVTTNLAEGVQPLATVERDLTVGALREQHQKGEFFLFGFVVMPTHVHLLLYPQNKDLAQIMRNLKSKTGYEISQNRHTRGPIWQERYFDAIVRRVRNFWEKLDYIHRNPVEAGLVGSAEEWRWSSYRYYFNREEGLIPVDPVGFSSDGDQFLWPAPWR
jgi:REP element-mobilizing transposase RayT